jgi:hypothetical protein
VRCGAKWRGVEEQFGPEILESQASLLETVVTVACAYLHRFGLLASKAMFKRDTAADDLGVTRCKEA